MPLIKELLPRPHPVIYTQAVAALAASDRTWIAHIDAGLAPHKGLGYDGARPPQNIRFDLGANTFDPDLIDGPFSPLTKTPGLVATVTEVPDHGVKTLSIILGPGGEFTGVAPGATIVPFRVSNGPLFRQGRGPIMGERATASLGRALDLARALPQVRVVTISMGNPNTLGPFDALLFAAGFRPGFSAIARKAVSAAYEGGVIVVCAAGQIINSVIFPARLPRAIAVGGFDREGLTYSHYPRQGYLDAQLVDVWAQAERLNRANYLRDGTESFGDAGGTGDPSGTSYAAPQVAAAAALWVERHHDDIEDKAGQERWRIVEMFRAALHASTRETRAWVSGDQPRKIRPLDIPALLATPPVAFTGPKAAALL